MDWLDLQGSGGAVNTVRDVQSFQLWIVFQDRREKLVCQPVAALYDERSQVGGGMRNVLEEFRGERKGRSHFQFFVNNKKCIYDFDESPGSLTQSQPRMKVPFIFLLVGLDLEPTNRLYPISEEVT